jgi:hypothetical protein
MELTELGFILSILLDWRTLVRGGHYKTCSTPIILPTAEILASIVSKLIQLEFFCNHRVVIGSLDPTLCSWADQSRENRVFKGDYMPREVSRKSFLLVRCRFSKKSGQPLTKTL